MIKLLIVDDEAFIRQGIRTTIPWHTHDIEVAGEASNGRDALKLALQLQPDIVLADIQMPVMNGLELAKQLNDLLPRTKVIILSAYGNTENFTSAIETKVSRFVLKNANAADILNSVLQVKEEILKTQENYTSYMHINHIYEENQHLIKSTLLIRYLTRGLSLGDFTSKIKLSDLDLSGPQYTMLLTECSSSNDWLIINAFKNAYSKYRPFAFFIKEHQLVLILNMEGEIGDEEMQRILPEIQPYICSSQLALMNRIEAFAEFPMAYESLVNCLDYCFWNTGKEYTLITPTYTFRIPEKYNLPSYEKQIISALLDDHTDSVNGIIQQYYEFCQANCVPKSIFLDSVNRLLLLISAVVPEDINVEESSVFLSELETPYEIIEYIKTLAKPSTVLKSQMPQIADTLAYINENYNKDLRLEDVAKEVALSVGYLSRIFKAETGYSFKEWINRVRIEKAKKLITTTDLKYYEVAERVGYKDYKYFAAYFNKFCNCSAKEYKAKHRCSTTPD